MISLINCNSPLRWDDRMLDAQFEYNKAAQPVVLTPFLLMGAMSPVSIPATLAQQIAETLAGISLSQLIGGGRPCPPGRRAKRARCTPEGRARHARCGARRPAAALTGRGCGAILCKLHHPVICCVMVNN